MKKKYLIIGPAPNKDPKTHGGTPVLLNQLLSYLKDKDRDFIFIQTIYFGEKKRVSNYIYVLYMLFKSIKKVDIVMINVSSTGAYFLAPVVLFISKIFKKKFVFRRFAGNCIELYESSSLWKRKLMDYIINYADILLYEPKYLVDYFSKKSARVYWFPNSRIKSNIIRDTARPYQKKFIFLGEVRQGKGVDEILKASESLDETYTIDIYGTMHYDSKYTKDLFNKYVNVNYRGVLNHDDVYQKLSEYDVLLLPSYQEGYPGVIIEAFAVGLPIIATNLSSIKEMTDKKCSILIDSKNVEQLVNAIKVFNESNFEEYSRNSLKMFNNYEQKHVHEKLIYICEENQ